MQEQKYKANFPHDPRGFLAEHGEAWMQMPTVMGVGLAWREEELFFVVMTNDAAIAREVPAVIGGYPTRIEAVSERSAKSTSTHAWQK